MKVENHLSREESALRKQLVLVLRDVDKLTYAKIGQRLGVSTQRAIQLYRNANRTLRGKRLDNMYLIPALAELLRK